jgi:hypothetical protein
VASRADEPRFGPQQSSLDSARAVNALRASASGRGATGKGRSGKPQRLVTGEMRAARCDLARPKGYERERPQELR